MRCYHVWSLHCFIIKKVDKNEVCRDSIRVVKLSILKEMESFLGVPWLRTYSRICELLKIQWFYTKPWIWPEYANYYMWCWSRSKLGVPSYRKVDSQTYHRFLRWMIFWPCRRISHPLSGGDSKKKWVSFPLLRVQFSYSQLLMVW